ncbi:MAG: hypothetical protein DRQ54_06690 [Gammaproteobacteria bacterium]|nr:MAG: hypothetical protein DRQ54_06690 [Gammaproteobacteria bacterium]
MGKYPGSTLLIVFTVLISAGATIAAEETIADTSATQCVEPRPQMCTMDYRPVCATMGDGIEKTFANGCSACSDEEAKSWVEGDCE